MPGRLTALRLSWIILAFLPVVLLGCNSSAGVAEITGAVTAKDVSGDLYEPVGVTSAYPADQVRFHAIVTVKNAPSETVLKAVWTAVDVGSVAGPNTKIDETEIQVQGSRNVDFTLAPQSGSWPPGAYRVEIFLNGRSNRILDFSVASPVAARAPTETVVPTTVLPTIAPTDAVATPATGCVPAAATPAKPSGLVSGVTLARQAKPETKEPINPTSTFAPDATFHAIASIKNAPANTSFRASWYASDIGSSGCNIFIDSTSISSFGNRNLDFSLTPDKVWPTGSYRVEIYVNEVLDRMETFSVTPPATPVPAATTTPTLKPTAGPTAGPRPTGAPSTSLPARTATRRPNVTITPTPDPNPCKLTPGNAGLYVINHFDAEMTLTIVDHEYHIPAHGELAVQFPGGKPFTINAFILGIGRSTSGPFILNAGECRLYEPSN